jgi:hypothetical protein
MVKKYLLIFTLFSFYLCASCQRHAIMKVGNEKVLKNPKYKLDYTLDEAGKLLIDTLSVYVYQGDYFKFYTNGDVIRGNIHSRPPSTQIHPNSVYRGKYELKENKIRIELFTPVLPSYFSNGWKKYFQKGVISNDTIKINDDNGFIHNYIRQTNWK